ncbi:hypothetical protein BCR42DRAFT_434159 [Absidia repens]|uniref:Uncharacterized protein n=1 Tax=Absidia repens TaxID=90262 RepID=A0A1X2IRS7_9FUNG|nr:hypothetical protein BCR42DRAFT_434159 [Absidia repens]
MNIHTEKRVRRQQKKPNYSPQLSMVPISPPTSPQDGNITTRWGSKTLDGGSEDDIAGHTTTEKHRGGWTDSSKRKLSPRSSAPDGPTAADPFAGMKTCINYQQEIERLKTLVPKVESKKRSSQNQQQHHQRSISSTMTISESNVMDPEHNADTAIVPATVPTTADATAAPASTALPTLNADDDTTASIISSTTKTTSVPSSSSSSSSLSHISSNSSSSSLSSSHDSLSSSLSSACSPPSSINSIMPPTSHSSILPHETPSSTHTTSDSPVGTSPTTASNELMEQLNTTVSPKVEKRASSTSVITDEEKARFLEFMRSWTGGLNGWNERPMEQKGYMWNQQPSSRQPPLWTRSEPCSPLHQDIRMDSWPQHQQQQQQQQQQQHQQQHQYLHQQLHQQLPPTTVQLDIGHRQQPCFAATSPPLHSPLPKSLQQQQQQILYSSSMHPHQKQQQAFHHQQYQHHHSSSLHLHQLQQQQQHAHSLHFHQQQPTTPKEWYGSSGIKSSSTLPSQVGTIGDRSSSPSVSRTNSRNHGPFSVSVM